MLIASIPKQAFAFDRQKAIDSLFTVYKNPKLHDTTRAKAIQTIIGSYYMFTKPDTAIILSKEALAFAQQAKLKKVENNIYYNLGCIYYILKDNYPEALRNYFISLKISEQLGDKETMGNNYNCIAGIYSSLKNHIEALKNYMQCFKLLEENKPMSGDFAKENIKMQYTYYLKDYKGALKIDSIWFNTIKKYGTKQDSAGAFASYANTYELAGNFTSALQNYIQALRLYPSSDTFNIVIGTLNIGKMYLLLKKYKEANLYIKKTEIAVDLIKNTETASILYFNIGCTYEAAADSESNAIKKNLFYQEAYENYLANLEIRKDFTGNPQVVCSAYTSVAQVCLRLKKYREAENYYKQALVWGKSFSEKKRLNLDLSNLYTKMGKYQDALQYYKKYISSKDSIENEENTKKLVQEQMQYEFDKKEIAAKAEQEKKDTVAASESKKQKIITGSVVAGLLLVLVFAGFVVRSLRISNKQKQIIEIKSKETEQQKHVIEEKQLEIIDSITYAKRLQRAILPSLNAVKEQLPNSFVYYQPKDIVAGDFYWMHTSPFEGGKGDVVFIAAADCTGHGVPGAMVSVVCSNALNRAVNEFNLTDTALILDKTRELVIETFEKSDAEVKDGMDISLLRIENLKDGKKQIQWSGANNSLWYILNNELIEAKADKQPIGKYSEAKPFKANNFTFTELVTFYLFSDGYADQFSPDDKKLMKKKFKDIVLSIQNLSMQEQKDYLDKFHTDWKSNMEQTDDVLVIGVKV